MFFRFFKFSQFHQFSILTSSPIISRSLGIILIILHLKFLDSHSDHFEENALWLLFTNPFRLYVTKLKVSRLYVSNSRLNGERKISNKNLDSKKVQVLSGAPWESHFSSYVENLTPEAPNPRK